MRRRCTWKGIQAEVKKIVRECKVCPKCKPKRQRKASLLRPLAIPRQRWPSLGIDFLCELPVCGEHYMIAVVVCRLTKMAHFIPCATTLTAEGCVDLLKQRIFRYHGIPLELVSHRDPRFTSRFWARLLKMLDVGSLKSTTNHPRTDGQTEQVNGSLINILTCYLEDRIDEGDTWLSRLVEAEMVYIGSLQSKPDVPPTSSTMATNLSYPMKILTSSTP